MEKKNKHKKVSSLSVGRGDASPGAPPRLGELWVTDPTPDSLRLSWTVPEGHFDSFVVQFKDRDGPRVVSVEGHERSVTISPLDSGRKYRFLVYGLLGKRRHGPLTAEGTTGEGSPCRGCPWSGGAPGEGCCGHLWWLSSWLLFGSACLSGIQPISCTSPKTQSCRAKPQLSPIFRPLSPSLQEGLPETTISSLCFHLRDPQSSGRGWNKASLQTTSRGRAAGDRCDIRLRGPVVDGP